MKLIGLIGVLTILGCGGEDPPIIMHGDVNFTDMERGAIMGGAWWVAEQIGKTPPIFEWNLRHYEDWESLPKNSLRRGRGEAPCGMLAYTGGGTITMDADHINPVDLPYAGAHEFAHLFGVGHHGGDGIMGRTSSWATTRVLEWTADDRARCIADKVCNTSSETKEQ